MDGPYHIVATRLTDDELKLRCIERGRTELVIHEEVVTMAALRGEVRRLAQEVAAACTRAGLKSDDVAKLKGQLPN